MRRPWVLVAAPVLLAAAACGSSSSPHYPPATPAPVQLTEAAGLKTPLHIGMVVTTASNPGEGADDLPLAEGAQVAAYRLGSHATLDVADDHGTASGAVAAVKQLISEGAAGIVYASEGSHVTAGLTTAAAANVPVLLPYDTDPAVAKPGKVWLTGPSNTQILGVMKNVLTGRSLSKPLVLESGPDLPTFNAVA